MFECITIHYTLLYSVYDFEKVFVGFLLFTVTDLERDTLHRRDTSFAKETTAEDECKSQTLAKHVQA